MTCEKCTIKYDGLPVDQLKRLQELQELEQQHLNPCAKCPFAGEHCCPFHHQLMESIRKERNDIIGGQHA